MTHLNMIDVQTIPGGTRAGPFSDLPKGTYWFDPVSQSMYNSDTDVFLLGQVVSTGQRWPLRTKYGVTLQVKLSELFRLIKQREQNKPAPVPVNAPVFPTPQSRVPKYKYIIVAHDWSEVDRVVYADTLLEADARAVAMINSGLFVSATVAATCSTTLAPGCA